MYSPQTINHYQNPRNVGTIKDADGVGVVGTPASGEMIKLTIKVSGSQIHDAKFKAFGCPAAIAVSSVLTELITGLQIEDALKITDRDIETVLGNLPSDKRRYATFAAEVLKTAIHDYLSRNKYKEENSHDYGH